MFHKPNTDFVNYEQRFWGICATCKHRVACFRHQAKTDIPGKQIGGGVNPFGDVPHVECPQCESAVYLRPEE